ncbi:MAG: AgmX/PglI C-terminal domain-containing protein [Deltaproteobacteria bacterium]|nr:AgmX/PglI C-terminal domain-containing protein [Deltaproteobacteria bacterium]
MRTGWGLAFAMVLFACGGEQRDAAVPAEPEGSSTQAAAVTESAAPTSTAAPSAAQSADAQGEAAGTDGAEQATVPLLTADLIRDVVRPQYQDIAVCYQEGLSRDPKLAGTVEVALTIAGDGSVIDAHQKEIPKAQRKQPARHADHPITDATVVDCVVAKFKAIRFPASRRGMMTTVYPIVFATE